MMGFEGSDFLVSMASSPFSTPSSSASVSSSSDKHSMAGGIACPAIHLATNSGSTPVVNTVHQKLSNLGIKVHESN